MPVLVAAIPVRDEEDRIADCLQALAAQQDACLDHVVLLLNNCTDHTAAIVRAAAPTLPFGVTCAERSYPAANAHAGTARREAMSLAAGIAGPDGILFTSDADGRVTPNWLSANLAAMALGAEAVCGRAEIDPVEARAIPDHLHADDAAEVAYGTLLDRIHDLVDPDPNDPWPRHTEHSGASIAVTVDAWARAGGVPGLASGEDRGFLKALRQVDVPIRHAAGVVVTVSGRTLGRAPGGMAETMARRIIRQDEALDDNLEPAVDCLRRAKARATLHALFGSRHRAGMAGIASARSVSGSSCMALAKQVGLPPELIARWLEEPFFGAAWARLEAESPLLIRRPVPRADLARHHEAAERIVHALCRQDHHVPARARVDEPVRSSVPFSRPAGPAGIHLVVPPG
ncbi:glycosyltransferase family 2 protein [Lichenicola cladoniae]|uniref:Glycosyltransferase family 2 protein n=2 Tax=Lichenicola cladoniae TaxID=1484109 RepID=A0A6M8HWZ9_9PROT|nr:glycosyltransferase family 2 protein [Acetobacteraceae bacterium]QKE92766.1 glycosyltransferase family 2 protein [Lichenicola cladoniae]